MTPILRANSNSSNARANSNSSNAQQTNSPLLPLPDIEEEQLTDEEPTPQAQTFILNQNVPSEMLQTRNNAATPQILQTRNVNPTPRIVVPAGAECNTENSFFDDY